MLCYSGSELKSKTKHLVGERTTTQKTRPFIHTQSRIRTRNPVCERLKTIHVSPEHAGTFINIIYILTNLICRFVCGRTSVTSLLLFLATSFWKYRLQILCLWQDIASSSCASPLKRQGTVWLIQRGTLCFMSEQNIQRIQFAWPDVIPVSVCALWTCPSTEWAALGVTLPIYSWTAQSFEFDTRHMKFVVSAAISLTWLCHSLVFTNHPILFCPCGSTVLFWHWPPHI